MASIEPVSRGITFKDTSTPSFRLEDHTARFGRKIWTLTLDLPGEKVNKLGKQVLGELEALLPALVQLGEKKAIEALVLVSGKPANFIAGADIRLIQDAKTPEEKERMSSTGQSLLNRWEDLPFVKVAAISGMCLGGGCEWALASDAIVMSSDPKTKIGLPEVMLGFIPGMGGCVRLPWKLGVAQALDFILNAKQLTGDRAYKLGMIEACVPRESFTDGALQWVLKNLSRLQKGERLSLPPKLGGMGGVAGKLLESTPVGRAVIFSKARDGVLKKTRGHYPALLEAIDVVRSTGTGLGSKWRGSKREKAMRREAQGFGKCAGSNVSKNLVRIFFLTEDVKKSNGLSVGVNVNAKPVDQAGVLGAGTMGGGIAQLFADKGVLVRMKDLNVKGLELGIKAAQSIFKKSVETRRITPREMIQKLNHIAPVLDYTGFSSLDLVVEAIVEKMEIKKSVLREVEGKVRSDCILATNTSSLSVNEMQTALSRPENFVGMHFFNPVHKMPLVEVIRGAKTSDEAVTTVFELCKRIGKTPVVVKDGAGFLVNRLLVPYLNEAIYLLSEGVPVEEIDEALLSFGMPMGPMELIDEVGIDIGDHVLKILFEAFGDRMTPASITSQIVKSGRLGKKTAKGVYAYEGRKKTVDPEIYNVIKVTPEKGKMKPEVIVDRCVLPMINEAARCLADQIVMTPADVDLGMIMGTGFPPFRGGLLRYADDRGVASVVKTLSELATALGPKHEKRYAPGDALKRLASENRKFYD